MELSKLQIDPKKDTAGRWVPYEDAQFLIAAHMNPKHRNALSKLSKRFRASARDQEKSDQLSNQALAEAVLLDWKGMTLNGEEFPYTRENALLLLNTSRPLRDFVFEAATEFAAYTQEGDSADAEALKSGPSVAATVG